MTTGLAHPAAEELARVPLLATLTPLERVALARHLEAEVRRDASVVATEPGTMWCMFGTTFRVLEAEHPEIAAIVNA